MFGYFYNSSMRRYTVLLMDLLSGVQVERTRGDQKFYNKVPITNASKERFIIKLNNAFSFFFFFFFFKYPYGGYDV